MEMQITLAYSKGRMRAMKIASTLIVLFITLCFIATHADGQIATHPLNVEGDERQIRDGVSMKLIGSRHHVDRETLLIRVEFWGQDLATVNFGRPEIQIDGEPKPIWGLCFAETQDWSVPAGAGHDTAPWSVRRIKSLPGRVDLEIPLRRTYTGEPYFSNHIQVNEQRQSLNDLVTDYETLSFPHIWWQPKGTTATNSNGGSVFLRESSVCIEWTITQTKNPPDPIVDRRLELVTVDGQSLRFRSSGGSGGVFLSNFPCDRPQTVRVKWTPTHAKGTDKTFVFPGITPQQL
jgi:hypothetical protein